MSLGEFFSYAAVALLCPLSIGWAVTSLGASARRQARDRVPRAIVLSSAPRDVLSRAFPGTDAVPVCPRCAGPMRDRATCLACEIGAVEVLR